TTTSASFLSLIPQLPTSTLFPYTTLFRSFQQAPAPLLLLELDGTIRRANTRAAQLLGAPTGYATGKSLAVFVDLPSRAAAATQRSEEHTSELQSRGQLVCRLLLEKKKKKK